MRPEARRGCGELLPCCGLNRTSSFLGGTRWHPAEGRAPSLLPYRPCTKAITLYASHQVYSCVQGQATVMTGSSLDTVPQDADLYYWKADAGIEQRAQAQASSLVIPAPKNSNSSSY